MPPRARPRSRRSVHRSGAAPEPARGSMSRALHGNMVSVSMQRLNRERRLSTELKYALITIVVIAVYLVLQATDALTGVNETVSEGVDRLARLGSIGVFFIALVANASIIIQIPYTLPLLSAALGGAGLTSMLVL